YLRDVIDDGLDAGNQTESLLYSLNEEPLSRWLQRTTQSLASLGNATAEARISDAIETLFFLHLVEFDREDLVTNEEKYKKSRRATETNSITPPSPPIYTHQSSIHDNNNNSSYNHTDVFPFRN